MAKRSVRRRKSGAAAKRDDQTGRPIEELATISPSYAQSLRKLGIHTVEALASLSDVSVANIMGAGGVRYRDLTRESLGQLSASTSTAPRNASPPNGLVTEGVGPVNTIEHCQSVLEFVRQSTPAGQSDEIEFGRFLVLGLVYDALDHAKAQIQRQAEVGHA